MSTIAIDSKKARLKIFNSWKALRERCNNPNNIGYADYGGRGITCCDEWSRFEPFFQWAMSHGYRYGLQIDRIDNDKGYNPENYRWVTPSENSNNRRSNVLLKVDGVSKTQKQWAEHIGCSDNVIWRWRKERGDDYAIERIKQTIKEGGYAKAHYRGKRKPVINLESGREFPSIRKAAIAFGIYPSSLQEALLDRNGKTKVGTFQFK